MSARIFKYIWFASLTLTFFTCSIFTPTTPKPGAVDIEREEQAVYATFLSGSRGLVLILQDTSTSMGDDPQRTIDYIRSGLKNMSTETLENFLERNKQPSQLSPDMDLGAPYTLISRDDLHKITSQSNWEDVLNETYPGSHGYMMFSRVGFNDTLGQALVYVGQVARPLMGAGYYYLMEKRKGQWTIKGQVMVWIS
ncbi:MAG: hypothetical protein M1282_12465 [Chloroflexi bacterium]|nr:hypothetical protein [Chloroflexota bacterium]